MSQTQSISHTKTAQVFMSGRSQAVRLPIDFRFKTKEVMITRIPETGELLLSPKETMLNWQNFFALADSALVKNEIDDFLLDRIQEPSQKRDIF